MPAYIRKVIFTLEIKCLVSFCCSASVAIIRKEMSKVSAFRKSGLGRCEDIRFQGILPFSLKVFNNADDKSKKALWNGNIHGLFL